MMIMRDKGKYMAQAAGLKMLLSSLLGVTSTRIYLPAEFQDKRYDLSVTLKDDKTEAYKPLAAQAIETALGLKVKRTTREAEVYVLTTPPQLTGSLKPTRSKTFHASSAEGVLAAVAADFRLLVASLEEVLKLPVIDETKLQGKFDWDLVYDGQNPQSIVEAVRKEFGLELTLAKRSVEIILAEKE
jgi:uncharacterized protein (TIGR03435 family)